MLRIAAIEDGRAFESLEPDWWTLWRDSAATPFQSPAWLIPWWRAFAPGRLRALSLWDRERLVALAPFYLETGTGRLLPVGIGPSDYLDVLLAPGAGDQARGAIMRGLADFADWHTCELEELPPWAAAHALAAPGCGKDVSRQSACPVLPLAGDGFADVPARQRRKLRMARRRGERRGMAIRLVEAGETWPFLHALVDLHRARRAERGEAGAFADPRVRDFHARAIDALARAGLLRAFVADCERRAVGAYYGFCDGRRACAYLGGFDPEFAFESPGTALLGAAIEHAKSEDASEFHFLRGREAYKYAWGAQDRWNLHRSLRRRG